jgi:AFG3 family protein
MSPKLGTINYAAEEGYMKAYSEKTGKLIDEEVRRVIDESYIRCKAICTENKHLIEK